MTIADRPQLQCPDDALVLLDEALQSLPPKSSVRNFPSGGQFSAPFLSPFRTSGGKGTTASTIDTWTVEVRHGDLVFLLEWWDDHWIMADQSTHKIAWRGQRLADAPGCQRPAP